MSVLRRNLLWLLVSQGLTWLISVVLLVLGPKRLDPDGFGRYVFATAYVGLFLIIGGLGTYPYITRRVAQDRAVLTPLVKATAELKVVLALGLSAAALGLAWMINVRGESLVLIAIGCMAMSLQLFCEVVAAGLAGMERIAGPAMWQVVQVYVGAALGLTVLLTSRSVVLFALAVAIAWLIPLVANSLALRPHLRLIPADRTNRIRWKTIIVGGAPLMLLIALTTVYGTIDIPLLNRLAGSEEVGWYSVAYKWVAMPLFIMTIVAVAFFPQMSAAAATSMKHLAALTNRALRLVLIVTIPASVGMIIIASDLLHFIYGDQYNESISLMQILAVHIPVAGVDTILVASLIAAGRQNRYVLVALTAAILNPPLVVLAIHVTENRYGNAAIGAALVTVLTEVGITVCALWMRPEGVFDRHTAGFALRCGIASGVMAIVLWILKDAGLFVKVAAGGATYGLVSLALGTVSAARVRALMADIRVGRNAASVPTTDGSHEMSDTGADR